MKQLRIATWNVGQDFNNEEGIINEGTYLAIVKQIVKNHIDIICLQEAITTSNRLGSLATYIQKKSELIHIEQMELSPSDANKEDKMGVCICSREKIINCTSLLLQNPRITFRKSDTLTYYSHDKGFLLTKLEDITVISGHCLPFHIFNQSPLQYKQIYQKLENKILDTIR